MNDNTKNWIYTISSLNDSIELCDSFIDELRGPVRERLIFGNNNKVSIEIDHNLVSVFKDVKKTTELAKNLYSQIMKTKRKVVTSSFEKYFRLISENTRKLVGFVKQIFNDKKVILRLPTNLLDKGKTVIDSFVENMNSVFTDINSNNHTELISLVDKPKWLKQQEIEDWKREYNRRKAQGYSMA
jgi:hypothetical protein